MSYKRIILTSLIFIFSSNLTKGVTLSRFEEIPSRHKKEGIVMVVGIMVFAPWSFFALPYVVKWERTDYIKYLVRQGFLEDFEIETEFRARRDNDDANAYITEIKNSPLGNKLESFHETLSLFKLPPLQAADGLSAEHWSAAVQGLPTSFESWETRCETLLRLSNIAYTGNVIYDGNSYPLFIKNKNVAGRIYARFLEEMEVDETWKVIFDELNNHRNLPRILEEDYRFVINKLEELNDGQTYIFESNDPQINLPFSSEKIPVYSVKRLLQAKSKRCTHFGRV